MSILQMFCIFNRFEMMQKTKGYNLMRELDFHICTYLLQFPRYLNNQMGFSVKMLFI